jgi:ankyrin repeat protein
MSPAPGGSDDHSGQLPLPSEKANAVDICVFLEACGLTGLNGVNGCWTESNKQPWNALHYAAEVGRADVVQFLLDCRDFTGVDALASSEWHADFSALHAASHHGHTEIVNLLLRSDRFDDSLLNAGDRRGDTPLHMAAQGGHAEVMRLLLQDDRVDPTKCNAIGSSPLHAALAHGEAHGIALILADGRVPVNTENDFGQSALHAATSACGVQLMLACRRFHRTNSYDKAGRTALHTIISRGINEGAVRTLIGSDRFKEAGTLDKRGLSPLHWAIRKNYSYIARVLLLSPRLTLPVTESDFKSGIVRYAENTLKETPSMVIMLRRMFARDEGAERRLVADVCIAKQECPKQPQTLLGGGRRPGARRPYGA